MKAITSELKAINRNTGDLNRKMDELPAKTATAVANEMEKRDTSKEDRILAQMKVDKQEIMQKIENTKAETLNEMNTKLRDTEGNLMDNNKEQADRTVRQIVQNCKEQTNALLAAYHGPMPYPASTSATSTSPASASASTSPASASTSPIDRQIAYNTKLLAGAEAAAAKAKKKAKAQAKQQAKNSSSALALIEMSNGSDDSSSPSYEE